MARKPDKESSPERARFTLPKIPLVSWIWCLPSGMHVAMFCLETVLLATFLKAAVLYWQDVTRGFWIAIGNLISLSLEQFGRMLDLLTLIVLVFVAAFTTSIRNGDKHSNIHRESSEWSHAKLQRFVFGTSALISSYLVVFSFSRVHDSLLTTGWIAASKLYVVGFVIIFVVVLGFVELIFLYTQDRVGPIMKSAEPSLKRSVALALAVPGHLLLSAALLFVAGMAATAFYPLHAAVAIQTGVLADSIVSFVCITLLLSVWCSSRLGFPTVKHRISNSQVLYVGAYFLLAVMMIGVLFRPTEAAIQTYSNTVFGFSFLIGTVGLLVAFIYALHVDWRVLRNILIVAGVIVAGFAIYSLTLHGIDCMLGTGRETHGIALPSGIQLTDAGDLVIV